ncbi:MAG: translational GTPase TypA [Deltaproteobacteria bacterium]|nr:translational GTPase TypA [Deltaproteobacteria bacterium]
MKFNENIRNIAIIAHVDHGKTTLIDNMFSQSGIFRSNQNEPDRVMDNMDLEKERGITIAAKNCSVVWNDVKINIIDTPGHADFGGEVERALSMADGAVVLVDASEGPLPQTRFVLDKALEQNLELIVVINKVDRKDSRTAEVLNEIHDLFIDLNATEEQLEFTPLYAIGKDGQISKTPDKMEDNLFLLFDTILEKVPPPTHDENAPFQMLVSDLGYNDYLGRLAIGKIANGSARANDDLICMGKEETNPLRISKLQTYKGTEISTVEKAQAGEIIVLAGIEDVNIGDTICHRDEPVALKRIRVDEPTVHVLFTTNKGPYKGTEGKYVQSSKLRERLFKETLLNVAIQVEETEEKDSFLVKGRGEFQMVILMETMRREGYEFCVGRPEVNFHHENGQKLEPIKNLIIDCPEEHMGIVTEKLMKRKGQLVKVENNGERVKIEFSIPARSLIGYRDTFLTDTKGAGIMNSWYKGYEEYRGDFTTRFSGSIVADRMGKAIPYAIYNLEPRGIMFVEPGDLVYEGMVVGEHNRFNDLNVNICKEKKLTNIRAAGKDDNVVVTKIKPMTLEKAITFIKYDELVEVTPQSIRLRKTVLSAQKRHNISGQKKKNS